MFLRTKTPKEVNLVTTKIFVDNLRVIEKTNDEAEFRQLPKLHERRYKVDKKYSCIHQVKKVRETINLFIV